MILTASRLQGRVTFITGPEKGSGKTTLLNYCLGLLRVAGERPAFMGIGFDGEGCPDDRSPRIACHEGEVFVTAASYLAASGCWPEVLEALPGSTSLGRLAVVRARRDGHAVLVGHEHNDSCARAIDLIRSEGWARTVLVDGAMNRITQVAVLAGAQFLFAARVNSENLSRNAAVIRRLVALASLPALPDLPGDLDALAEASGLPLPAFGVDGPLTATSLAGVPESAATIVVDDFTKVFLDGPGLSAVCRERVLAVRTSVDFGGFCVALRDVDRDRFLLELADPAAAALIAFNPYRAGWGEENVVEPS